MTEAGTALAGRVIALAETRELDVFAALLQRRGASVLRYPLVQIVEAPDPAVLLEWLRAFAAGACDDLILQTGEGLRRLLACLRQHEPALEAAFRQALAQVRKITRGPKPVRALRELGLHGDLEADEPTTAGVIATLARLDLRGRRVGVQLYGDEPNRPLIESLRAAGARVLPVAPYRYADSPAPVRELIERLASGGVDAIAFTSRAQVERLFRAAPPELVRAALARTLVAAVGPVVAEALDAHGVPVQAMPQASWFMKPLAAELAETLGAAGAASPH